MMEARAGSMKMKPMLMADALVGGVCYGHVVSVTGGRSAAPGPTLAALYSKGFHLRNPALPRIILSLLKKEVLSDNFPFFLTIANWLAFVTPRE